MEDKKGATLTHSRFIRGNFMLATGLEMIFGHEFHTIYTFYNA